MSAGGAASSSRSRERGERRLAAALGRLELVPVEITPLAALKPWSRTPRTYAVTTREQGRLKIRFARRARFAARAARLTGRLADPRIEPPLAVSGTAMLEYWVEGRPLSSVSLRAAHVDAAADILATIHGFPGGAARRGTAEVLARVSRHVADLAAVGMVTLPIARRLEQLVGENLPPQASWGLMHGDFCAENLVLAVDGTLASIDNELFGFGFLDYDLARAWYRWPMPRWAEDRFARSYDAASGRAIDERQRLAWRAVATVRGLRIRRLSRSTPELELRALGRVLEDASAGSF